MNKTPLGMSVFAVEFFFRPEYVPLARADAVLHTGGRFGSCPCSSATAHAAVASFRALAVSIAVEMVKRIR